MTTPLTFVELFAGVGGMSRGLELAGWQCKGHAEIEPFPRQVLAHRWPDIPLWGDVSTLNGRDLVAEVGPFTMLTFGAPCQDFSIAGTRQGLAGERSSLVHHALRIWEESGAPFALYENVVGMLSSNNGADFAAILSAIVGADVAVHAQRWKGGTGVVSGPAGVAAWRTLDGRYFGVPQRRRRVFVLAARAGSGRGREVLSLLDGLCGHPAPRGEARQADPRAVAVGAGAGGAVAFAENQRGEVRLSDVAMSVTNAGGKPGQGYAAVLDAAEILTFKVRGGVERDSAGKMAGKGYLGTTDEVFTIGTSPDQHIFDARGNGEGAVCPTLAGDHQNRVTDYTAIVVPESFRMVAFGEYDTDGTASAIKARDWKDATDLVVAPASLPRPRRLTPLECERLMGWPDGWTALPGAKDTPRYKACGNGVMSPVAGWIGWQLRAAIELEDLVG